jgi:hypothetical protein
MPSELIRQDPPLYREEDGGHRVLLVVTVDPQERAYHCYEGKYPTAAECDAFREGMDAYVTEDGLWAEAVTQERYDQVQRIMDGQEDPDVDLFLVVEYSSFFAVRHLPTGKEHPMGDGVDEVFENGLGEECRVGHPGFVNLWTCALNQNKAETLEAYFPDLDS